MAGWSGGDVLHDPTALSLPGLCRSASPTRQAALYQSNAVQGITLLLVTFWIIRIQLYGGVKRRKGVLAASKSHQGVAAAQVAICVARIDPHCLVERRERLAVAVEGIQGFAAAQVAIWAGHI